MRQIDKAIPYHILFVLTYEGKAQAWIGYKEASSGGNAFKVNRYYHTDWMPENELQFMLGGLNMDAVYENLVRQIAGDRLRTSIGESLKESVGAMRNGDGLKSRSPRWKTNCTKKNSSTARWN